MGKITTPRRPSVKLASRPYLLAIGRLTFAWNSLLETLGLLFGVILRPQTENCSMAIWHSLRSDRTQLEMFRAVVDAHTWPDSLTTAKEDVTWLIRETQKLADPRNDAIHSPYLTLYGMVDDSGELKVHIEPWAFHGNPRAKKLMGKDLLKEIEWYAEKARVLRQYAFDVHRPIWMPDMIPWPERPQMPHLGQSQTRTKSRPRKRAK